MVLRAAAVLSLSLCYSVCVMAQTEVTIEALPAWVVPLELTEFSDVRSAEFQFGIAYLLSDRQIRKTESGFDYAYRTATRVVDRSGLEAIATIAQSFDPEYETLHFNFLRIIRDGESIDYLPDTEIAVLRQESGLASGVIDGNLTALIQLADIRVGDIVDYSVSGSVALPLWPDEFFHVEPVQWSVPLAQAHFRLTVPERMELHAVGVATETEPEIDARDGWRTYSLHLFDPDPIHVPLDTPSDWVPYGVLQFSSMESWSEVAAWALPIFSVADPLPTDFAQKLDTIAAAYERPQDRAVQALRLVQSEIRYLSLVAGLGSHVPRAPSVTIENGFGDCKDKAVLLIAALDYLGIVAEPALASVAGGHILPGLTPSISNFDHVVVGIDLDGDQVWVDPTISHQGGSFENLAPLSYGYVLPIRAGQQDLVRLKDWLPDQPLFEIAETFEFPESGAVGMTIAVEQSYRFGVADAIRYQLASLGRDLLGRGLFDYYAGIYGVDYESMPFSVVDDIEANEIVFRAAYEMGSDEFRQSGLGTRLPVPATAVQNILPRQVEARRDAPLGLPYGAYVRHRSQIVTPSRRFTLPGPKILTVDGVRYEHRFVQNELGISVESELIVDEYQVPAESIRRVIDIADGVAGDSESWINMQAATSTMSWRLGLRMPMDGATESGVAIADQHFADGNIVGALAAVNELLEVHREPTELRGGLQLMKAMYLTSLRRIPAAIASYDEAFSLFEPQLSETYLFYLGLLSQDGQDAKAALALIDVLENYPDVLPKMTASWFVEYFARLASKSELTERDAMVLAMARAIHQHEPGIAADFSSTFSRAVVVLVENGEIDEASTYLTYLTAPDSIVSLLAQRKFESLWPVLEQQAGPGATAAISKHVELTRDALASDPEDYARLNAHISALKLAGRAEEAVTLAAPFASDWAKIEASGSDAFWFINQNAYALIDLGRTNEAIDLMTRLVDIGVGGNPSLVSMAINRAAMFMREEQFDEALAAVDEIEQLGDGYASEFGWVWINMVKSCSLFQLGRTEEADALWTDWISSRLELNPGAAIETLLCFNRLDEVADAIIERLENEKTRGGAILGFVRSNLPEELSAFSAELRHRADTVRASPDVQAALNRVGRSVEVNGVSEYWSTF